MMSLDDLISTYGYAAIGLGTFFEGETILVMGGFAAHRGYLELPWVIMCAFIGALSGDQLFFYVGRTKGQDFLERRPKWKYRSGKVFYLLGKHQNLLILGFRFLYGLRTVTPFLMGVANVSPMRFLSLDIIGAMLWAIVIGIMGYLFGYVLEVIIGNVKKYELLVFALLAFAGLILWLLHLRKGSIAHKSLQPVQKTGENNARH